MSISDPTGAELLTTVNAAILALSTHKVARYTIGQTSYEYQNLPALRMLRKDLRAEVKTGSSRVRLADVS